MKRIKNFAVLSAVILSMIICFDDSISLFLNVVSTEIPMRSDYSEVTYHHHFTLTDHFFQKNSVSDSNTEFTAGFQLLSTDQFIADPFQSSIWQPPQITC